jgi:hypothetical protein
MAKFLTSRRAGSQDSAQALSGPGRGRGRRLRIALGNPQERLAVEEALAQLEQQGFMLRAPVQRLWAGAREPAVLTDGLDATDAALVQRVLALIAAGG